MHLLSYRCIPTDAKESSSCTLLILIHSFGPDIQFYRRGNSRSCHSLNCNLVVSSCQQTCKCIIKCSRWQCLLLDAVYIDIIVHDLSIGLPMESCRRECNLRHLNCPERRSDATCIIGLSNLYFRRKSHIDYHLLIILDLNIEGKTRRVFSRFHLNIIGSWKEAGSCRQKCHSLISCRRNDVSICN